MFIERFSIAKIAVQPGGADGSAFEIGHMHFGNSSELIEPVKSGSVKALAVSTPERMPQLPPRRSPVSNTLPGTATPQPAAYRRRSGRGLRKRRKPSPPIRT
jgi:hypothetical protein